ncbi:RdgB/HAM1 family non-canonical purine NTP pyrophosphatase [candidate division WS5 bacterium]|uniref:RdgB/HAM1 family non-canonical purine NTP pyrophosphatase n=1 Tax=candidate division WS5 bacterium TaxID=2093353 RepID=A0A419DFN8_9BACT|nr:MAG: RdgB/HAM1 family non-canonical purine NTP pyrophosphatase [candidate division WS5 bacterium]
MVELKYFATGSKDKLREVNQILGTNLKQIDLDLLEPQGISVEEVVCEKAKDGYMRCGKPVLVEDTGLHFEAWNGLPGALVKWFVKSVGNKGIIEMFGNEKNRKARAVTAVGFYDGKKCRVFTGEVSGRVPKVAREGKGFGWDPVFVTDEHDKTFGEMDPVLKNSVSMRALALQKLSDFLNS